MKSPIPWSSPYKRIAQIGKTKGLDGQLVVQEMGEVSVLRQGLEVWVVPPALEGVRHTVITEVKRNVHKQGVLLKLDGVDDRVQAGKLTRHFLLTRKSEDSTDGFVPAALPILAESTTTPPLSSPALASPAPSSPALASPPPASPPLSSHALASPPLASPPPVSPPLASPPPASHALASPPLAFTDTTYGDLGELVSLKDGPAYDIWVIEGRYGHLEIPAVDAYMVEEGSGQILLSLPKGFIEITRVDNPL